MRDHQSSYLYSSRGLCYDSLGETVQALSDYNQAIEWDSTNAKAYLGRGSVYLRQGKSDQAFKELSKAISYNETTGAAYYFKGIIYLNAFNNAELACENFINGRRLLGYVKSVVAIRENCKK